MLRTFHNEFTYYKLRHTHVKLWAVEKNTPSLPVKFMTWHAAGEKRMNFIFSICRKFRACTLHTKHYDIFIWRSSADYATFYLFIYDQRNRHNIKSTNKLNIIYPVGILPIYFKYLETFLLLKLRSSSLSAFCIFIYITMQTSYTLLKCMVHTWLLFVIFSYCFLFYFLKLIVLSWVKLQNYILVTVPTKETK